MEQEILTKTSLFSKLPRWLRIVFIILSIITIIWWVCWLLWKVNKVVRMFLAWVSQPRNYYWFEGIFIFAVICGLFVAQFTSPFKPFSILGNKIIDLFNNFRHFIANLIV